MDDERSRRWISRFTQGRVWDGGPRGFRNIATPFESCTYQDVPGTPYPPNLRELNHGNARKYMDAVANLNRTNIYLTWANIGTNPAIASYSPKQHDFHAMNIEDIAYKSGTEMVIGLRSPLVNRTNGNAYYFMATNLATFLPAGGWTGPAQAVTEARQMALGGLGIRSIKWCPNGLPGGVPRYLVLAGNANGGPIQREAPRQRFALYAWNGLSTNGVASPQLLMADLTGYAVRPEGIDLISVNGEWRVLFVEDRFLTPGYATRNAVHWPVSILGNVP